MLALQLLASGLVTGCALGVVAISFSLVYATTKIFHVAHAGIYTLGGYLAWSLVVHGAPLLLAVLVAIAACTALGALIQVAALRTAGAAAGDASGGPDRLARCAGGDPEHRRCGLHAEHPAIPARRGAAGCCRSDLCG